MIFFLLATSSKGRWSTLQSTRFRYSKNGNRNTSGLVVTICCASPRFTAAFRALTNTNNKNNNKNRTHTHTSQRHTRTHPVIVGVVILMLLLLLLLLPPMHYKCAPEMIFHTRTHAQTLTQKRRHTVLVSALEGSTHARTFSSKHGTHTHSHTFTSSAWMREDSRVRFRGKPSRTTTTTTTRKHEQNDTDTRRTHST